MIPVKYNYRNLVVRKTTTIAAAFGLALVVFVFAAAQMLGNGIKKTLGRSAGAENAIVLRRGSSAEMESGIEENQVNLVLAQAAQIGASKKPPGVGEILVVILMDKLGTNGVSNVTVRGVPEDVFEFRNSAKIIEGRAAKPGTDEVVVGSGIRGRFKGLELGQSFDLKKNRPAKVVGVFADDGSSFESEVWADLHTVRTAFGREGYVSSVRVRLDAASKFDAFKALVEQNRQLGLAVQREADYYEKQSEATSVFLTIMGTMIAVLFSIGAMIGATITMNAQVANRQREIGTLRALGFSRRSILTSFLLESIVLATIGGLVGAAASLGLSFVKITMLNAGTWSEIAFTFEPTPAIIIRSMVLAGFMGVVGGFLPAIRAARVSPIEAMRASAHFGALRRASESFGAGASACRHPTVAGQVDGRTDVAWRTPYRDVEEGLRTRRDLAHLEPRDAAIDVTVGGAALGFHAERACAPDSAREVELLRHHHDPRCAEHVARTPHRAVGIEAGVIHEDHGRGDTVRLQVHAHRVGLVVAGGLVIAADDDPRDSPRSIQLERLVETIAEDIGRGPVVANAGAEDERAVDRPRNAASRAAVEHGHVGSEDAEGDEAAER
jgi:putative ABC transport system permease protein